MKKLSFLLIFLAGCMWGVMGLFVRALTSAGLTSFQISGVRSLLTAVLLAPVLLIVSPSLFKIKLKDLWCFLGTGILSITFFNCCYFFAINEVTISVAAILLYTAPIFVCVLSAIFFKERMTKSKIIALFICIIGCVLVTDVFFSEAKISTLGLLTGLGSGLGYALYSIFSRAAINRGYKTLTILFYTFLFSSVSLFFIVDFSPVFKSVADGSFPWMYAILQATVSTVIPYLIYTVGLKYTENSTASIIASTEPVVATLAGLIVFSEIPSVPSAIGIILVLGAIALLNTDRKKE